MAFFLRTSFLFKGFRIFIHQLFVGFEDACVQQEEMAWVAAGLFPTDGQTVEFRPMFWRLAIVAFFKIAVFDEIFGLAFLLWLFLGGQRGGEAKAN